MPVARTSIKKIIIWSTLNHRGGHNLCEVIEPFAVDSEGAFPTIPTATAVLHYRLAAPSAAHRATRPSESLKGARQRAVSFVVVDLGPSPHHPATSAAPAASSAAARGFESGSGGGDGADDTAAKTTAATDAGNATAKCTDTEAIEAAESAAAETGMEFDDDNGDAAANATAEGTTTQRRGSGGGP